MTVVDISNRSAPVVLGSVATPGEALDVTVSGTYAYVADGSAGLQVVDISNPSAPVITGSVDSPGDAQDIEVSGNFAYLADGLFGVQVMDVANKAAPLGVGSAAGNALGVVTANGYVWVAAGSRGFVVLPTQCP
jgi:hypothetical protein